jgi:hypothetical protein
LFIAFCSQHDSQVIAGKSISQAVEIRSPM